MDAPYIFMTAGEKTNLMKKHRTAIITGKNAIYAVISYGTLKLI